MTGAIEATGDVATGAAWSRTVAPIAGRPPAKAGHDACLNCGTELAGRYCHGCGQSAHVHRTLGSIVHDLLHGVFHFEGRIWRTVPMLVLHPGALTRRYIAGERARFVSPLALFLFTVFAMFSVYSATGPGDLGERVAAQWGNATGRIEQSRGETAAQLAAAERDRAAAVAAGRPHGQIDKRIASLRDDMTAMEQVGARLSGRQAAPADRWSWLKHVAVDEVRREPGLVIYKVQSAAYKFSWALIFLSTPFVALLFLWRRSFGLYDHATFVTYSISFMTLLIIVLELLVAANAPNLLTGALLLLVPPVRIFAQLRGAYNLRVLSALWRTAFLLAFAWLVLFTFVIGVVVLEVAH